MNARIFLATCLFLVSITAAAGERDESAAKVERGAYLARGVAACGDCHTPGHVPNGPGVAELSGNMILPDFYAPNITPDAETGIGRWSSEDITRALTKGLRPDGTRIHPIMPYRFYATATDDDLQAIVAFLKSLPPVSNKVPRNTLEIPPGWLDNPVPKVGPVDPGDRTAYGGYLVSLGHCMRCHTPMVDGVSDYAGQLGAGGLFLDFGEVKAVTANITPDPQSRISVYSVDQIRDILKSGIRPDGSALAPIMGFDFYKSIKDDDLEAIALYLKSLPPKPYPRQESTMP